MPLSWEAITALGSLTSSLAVLAAVIVAVRQVRVGADQVEHLRRATQLDGTMKVFERMGSPEQQQSRHFIRTELKQRLEDPRFVAEMKSVTSSPDTHPEVVSLQVFEMVGTYVKHGLLDEVIIFDYWYPAIVSVWEQLEDLGVIAIHRSVGGPTLWENFELLYRRAKRWAAEHDSGDGPRVWTRSGGQQPEPAGTKS